MRGGGEKSGPRREKRYDIRAVTGAATHVHFNVGLLRVHVTVVVVAGIAPPHVVALRYAVHQMSVQLVRIPEDFRRYDRGVTSESLKVPRVKREILCVPTPSTRYVSPPRIYRVERAFLCRATSVFSGILNFQPRGNFNSIRVNKNVNRATAAATAARFSRRAS